jgi:hypothetical protein
MQTKLQSLLEVFTNIVIGITISYFISTVVIPYYTGVKLKPVEYGSMTLIYTVASIIRSYTLRRFWNHIHYGRHLKKKQQINS